MGYYTNTIQVRFDMTVKQIYDLFDKGQLNMNPAYQRDYVAKDNKTWQQNLMKNIVEGESVIPYLYMRVHNDIDLFQYKSLNGQLMQNTPEAEEIRDKIIAALIEVIDGQQRSRTNIDFIDAKFPLGDVELIPIPKKDFGGGLLPKVVKLKGLNITDLKNLYPKIYKKYMDYKFTVVATKGGDEAIHQMFIDLNDLNQMSNQEKRNAIVSEMAVFVRETARLGGEYDLHPIFSINGSGKGEYLNFPFKRMGQDEVLAKIVAIVDGMGRTSGLNKSVLDGLYASDEYASKVKIQKKITDILDKCFEMIKDVDSKTYKAFNVGTFLNLVMVVHELTTNSDVKVTDWSRVWDWFYKTHIKLGKLTKKEIAVGLNETIYHQKTRLGQDPNGLDMRITILKMNGLYENDGVKLVDRKRVITDNEFAWMLIMADKKCQVSKKNGDACGKVLGLSDAVKAHKVAHSNSGETTIENTVVSCIPCNVVKVKNVK